MHINSLYYLSTFASVYLTGVYSHAANQPLSLNVPGNALFSRANGDKYDCSQFTNICSGSNFPTTLTTNDNVKLFPQQTSIITSGSYLTIPCKSYFYVSFKVKDEGSKSFGFGPHFSTSSDLNSARRMGTTIPLGQTSAISVTGPNSINGNLGATTGLYPFSASTYQGYSASNKYDYKYFFAYDQTSVKIGFEDIVTVEYTNTANINSVFTKSPIYMRPTAPDIGKSTLYDIQVKCYKDDNACGSNPSPPPPVNVTVTSTIQVPTTVAVTSTVTATTQVPTTVIATTQVPTTVAVPTTITATKQVPTTVAVTNTVTATTQVPTTVTATTQVPTTVAVPTTVTATKQVPTTVAVTNTVTATTQVPTTVTATTQIPTTIAVTNNVTTTAQVPTTIAVTNTVTATTQVPTTVTATTQVPTTVTATTQVPTTVALSTTIQVPTTVTATVSQVTTATQTVTSNTCDKPPTSTNIGDMSLDSSSKNKDYSKQKPIDYPFPSNDFTFTADISADEDVFVVLVDRDGLASAKGAYEIQFGFKSGNNNSKKLLSSSGLRRRGVQKRADSKSIKIVSLNKKVDAYIDGKLVNSNTLQDIEIKTMIIAPFAGTASVKNAVLTFTGAQKN